MKIQNMTAMTICCKPRILIIDQQKLDGLDLVIQQRLYQDYDQIFVKTQSNRKREDVSA